jgi:choice-of-anchor B domain-containing protein
MKHFYTAALLTLFSVNVLAQDSMNCELVFHWSDPEIPGSWAFDNAYNEIWGYAADGHEYAIIGTTEGTHIFDITIPSEAEQVQFIEGEVTGPNIIHRDFHDYAGYLYIVADEGASSLQIVDLSGLPDEVNVVYDSGSLFQRSHNIFIDGDNKILYSCGGNNQFNLYDLSDPTDPQLIVDCGDDVTGWSSSAGYVHDVYVEDNIAYCNGADGLYVVDFSNPTDPVFLATLTDYPESGYNHSGWLHEEGQYYALADETHGTRIKLLDVSDMTDIEVVSFMASGVDEESIVHNLIFQDDILHVSHYYDGYYAFDISDPNNPEVLAYYDTSEIPHDNSYEGAWGVYPFLPSGRVLVSDMQEGLFVFEVNLPTNVSEISSKSQTLFPNPAVAGTTLTLSNPSSEITTIDLFAMDGALVGSSQLAAAMTNFKLPTTLSKGIYTAKVMVGSTAEIIKLVVR